MPTYEYECKACGHRFEIFQNMSEAPIKTCPKCRKSVRRLIGGGAGIIFKGNGFYVTDSKSGSSVSAKPKAAETKAPEAVPAPAEKAEKTEKSGPAKEKKEATA